MKIFIWVIFSFFLSSQLFSVSQVYISEITNSSGLDITITSVGAEMFSVLRVVSPMTGEVTHTGSLGCKNFSFRIPSQTKCIFEGLQIPKIQPSYFKNFGFFDSTYVHYGVNITFHSRFDNKRNPSQKALICLYGDCMAFMPDRRSCSINKSIVFNDKCIPIFNTLGFVQDGDYYSIEVCSATNMIIKKCDHSAETNGLNQEDIPIMILKSFTSSAPNGLPYAILVCKIIPSSYYKQEFVNFIKKNKQIKSKASVWFNGDKSCVIEFYTNISEEALRLLVKQANEFLLYKLAYGFSPILSAELSNIN